MYNKNDVCGPSESNVALIGSLIWKWYCFSHNLPPQWDVKFVVSSIIEWINMYLNEIFTMLWW